MRFDTETLYWFLSLGMALCFALCFGVNCYYLGKLRAQLRSVKKLQQEAQETYKQARQRLSDLTALLSRIEQTPPDVMAL